MQWADAVQVHKLVDQQHFQDAQAESQAVWNRQVRLPIFVFPGCISLEAPAPFGGSHEPTPTPTRVYKSASLPPY
jgi:hypothetical protein